MTHSINRHDCSGPVFPEPAVDEHGLILRIGQDGHRFFDASEPCGYRVIFAVLSLAVGVPLQDDHALERHSTCGYYFLFGDIVRSSFGQERQDRPDSVLLQGPREWPRIVVAAGVYLARVNLANAVFNPVVAVVPGPVSDRSQEQQSRDKPRSLRSLSSHVPSPS